MPQTTPPEEFSLIDASISDLQHALSSGWLTSVDLAARYLRRIHTYDANGLQLSAIPIFNPSALDEAAASDARRAAGLPPRPLEGIPYLVKDNIKVKGMTITSGSPAFEHLVANQDAACVQALRNAGAVLLGRTNMPAMAYGGMQRGIWGRAESPYNPAYLAAAYASGSSNGSAVATTANFCAFSLGTETVSSGRSPASNNAVVAYTPSKGLLPIRGVCPLYPTCDVLVPHTRTMDDLFQVLDVLAVVDKAPLGDFYNEQKAISIPSIDTIRPKTFTSLQDKSSLRGKRIGVPSMYIGGDDSSVAPISRVQTRPSIIKLWQQARQVLEACGAEVIETDFPLVTTYESNAESGQLVTVANLPEDWPRKERCDVIAHAWDDFLIANDHKGLETLAVVDPAMIFPLEPGTLAGTPEAANGARFGEMVEYPHSKPTSIFGIPGLEQALRALEDSRKRTLEDWMDSLGLDAVVLPSNADVGAANADVDEEAARFAWSNGVKYSNGNRPMRHLGVPSVSVPMGIMEDTQMPVNLTFVGKAYEDPRLLEFAYAFEMATHARVPPPLVPALDTDRVQVLCDRTLAATQAPLDLVVERQSKEVHDSQVFVKIQGIVADATSKLVCYVNGECYDASLDGDKWSLTATYQKSERDEGWKKWRSPALYQTHVLIVAHAENGSLGSKLVIL